MQVPAELEDRWRAAVDVGDPLAALRAARELRESLLEWESQLARAALAGGDHELVVVQPGAVVEVDAAVARS